MQLEARVELNEKSNRALLEETVRLQGMLKGSLRDHESLIYKEAREREKVKNAPV